MKTLKFVGIYLILALVAIGTNACSSDDEEAIEPIGYIRLDQDRFYLSGEEQTFNVSLEANNVPVKAVVQWPYPWITSAVKIEEEPLDKNRHKEVYAITVEANDTGEERTANVDFWVGSGEKSHFYAAIFISQAPLNP